MATRTIEDPKRFLELAAAVMAVEAPNSVIIATARRLVDEPSAFDATHYITGDPVSGAMVVFDGRSALLTDLTDAAAGMALAETLAGQEAIEVIQANRPHVTAVLEAFVRATGYSTDLLMAMGAFSLSDVRPPPRPRGSMRAAGPADRDRVIDWVLEFADEAIPEERTERDVAGQLVDGRLDPATTSGLVVWECDGEVVAMSGHSGDTGTGIRVNLVYTPPDHRGHGYASALCAAQAEMLLAAGHRSVYLFTDLSNPTSNAIYERIGYVKVGESERHAIVRSGR